MQRDWIDVILLLTIGMVFQIFIPWLSHGKLDFTLAVLFLILVIKRNPRMILVSILVVGIGTAFTGSSESGFWISLVETLVLGGILYGLVCMTRRFFTNEVLFLCVVGVVGTLLHGLLYSLASTVWNGTTLTMFVNILKQVIMPALVLNVGTAYVLYVTLQHGETIRKDQYSEDC